MTVMEKGLEVYLDDPSKCVYNLDGGPIWIWNDLLRNYSILNGLKNNCKYDCK